MDTIERFVADIDPHKRHEPIPRLTDRVCPKCQHLDGHHGEAGCRWPDCRCEAKR